MLSSLILACFAIVLGAYFKFKYTDRKLPLPPGPPGDPLIGHIRSIPHHNVPKVFSEWGKRWGGLIHVHVLEKPMIIINDLSIARELLDKRGSIYSDRPRYVFLREMMGWDSALTFLRYGDRFRRQRKMMQQHFASQAVMRLRSIQRKEIYRLLEKLLHSPENYKHHVQSAITRTLILSTYGHHNDKYEVLVENLLNIIVASGALGVSLPDFIPILRYVPTWFPGASVQRLAKKGKEILHDIIELPYAFVKQERALGTSMPPSLISNLLEDEEFGDTDSRNEEEIKSICAIIYSAGFETSWSIILTFIFAMVRYPEVAKRAQDEIDSIVGRDCMPSIDDRESLPFVDCIFKECLRWYTPAPLGVPHAVLEDDNYHGMRIPKGATVIPNIWQMMRDERYYVDPEQFNPDRFHPNAGIDFGKLGIDENDYNPLNVVFGFGRRLCPGQFFAESSLWLTMASILAAFDIKRPLDANGSEYIPEEAFTLGLEGDISH